MIQAPLSSSLHASVNIYVPYKSSFETLKTLDLIMLKPNSCLACIFRHQLATLLHWLICSFTSLNTHTHMCAHVHTHIHTATQSTLNGLSFSCSLIHNRSPQRIDLLYLADFYTGCSSWCKKNPHYSRHCRLIKFRLHLN